MKSSTILFSCLCLLAFGATAVLAQDAGMPAKRLSQAASDGDIEQLKLYVARKADLNKPDERGSPPLCYAAEAANLETVKFLLEAGAKPNAAGAGGRTALIGAAQAGKADTVDALIAAGADVKGKDESGTTALHVAAVMGHLAVVESLIKAGADVNAEDRGSQTPLILAQRRQQTDIVDLLKAHGAKEPVLLRPGMDLYGDQAGMGPGAVTAPARNAEVALDPNAIKEEVKAFDGLAGLIKAVSDKGESEAKGWIQRRIDNRTTLLRAVDKQFVDELTFIRSTSAAENAAKTTVGIDELLAKRKQRNVAITQALREERRAALEQNADSIGTGRGRGGNRGMTSRGRGAGTTLQSAGGPYGNSGTTMTRVASRPEPNRPPIDGDTQAQIQAWLNGKPESKDTLLSAVYKLDLAELDELRTIATEEQAKRTAATVGGIMVARQERMDRITNEWRLDDERQAKLQERMGTQGQQGTYGVRGQRGVRGGASGQNTQQPGTTGTRRYR